MSPKMTIGGSSHRLPDSWTVVGSTDTAINASRGDVSLVEEGQRMNRRASLSF